MPDLVRSSPGAQAAPATAPPAGSGADDTKIEAAVRAVLGTMAGDLSANEAALLGELEGLGRTINNAKREIARLKVDDITGSHIPTATDELDAIVEHTARATNEILDCCEIFENVASVVGGEQGQLLQSATTRVYEACSFQDITGQRISKVVATLKAIEARIATVTEQFVLGNGVPQDAVSEGRRLAHGPQLPGVAATQAEIDRLLAEL